MSRTDRPEPGHPSPQLSEAGGDNLLVRHLTPQDADVAGELVHAGDEFRRDRRVVIGQVAADQFGDQLGRGGGKSLRPTSVARLTSASSAFWVLARLC
jgi:hypothetical protein